METLQAKIMEMDGALNAALAQVKILEAKIRNLEDQPSGEAPLQPPPAPRTEYELKEICQLPDRVKELQPFDGNPTQYVSWIHSVESILSDYEIVRNKPIYRAILQSIRQKVRGGADTALVSYNIFDPDWAKIKECLSLHYADKRDVRTLEHQLAQLTQRNSRLDEFYAAVNHQFSLIINKIKTENYSRETVDALIETYRNRALDVFIRGLNGDLSRLLIVQKPKTFLCLEMQNISLRSTKIHPPFQNQVTVPVNMVPRVNPRPQAPQGQFKNFQSRSQHNFRPWTNSMEPRPLPPRPLGPKPAEKMEVDRSIQSRNVNYMNRVPGFKRTAGSDKFRNPFKQQKLFNMFTEYYDSPPVSMVNDDPRSDYSDAQVNDVDLSEVNFMTRASLPAFHT